VVLTALWFALSLFASYDVPLPYGLAVYEYALAEDSGEGGGLSPFDLGALLMAENRGKRYMATTVGRYGSTAGTKRAERGLFQLVPYWAKKCGISRADLFDAYENIKCAAHAVRHMQDRAGARKQRPRWSWRTRFGEYASQPKTLEDFLTIGNRARPDWRTHYRCHPKHRASVGCSRSVRRVLRMQRRLHKAWSKRHTAVFWFVVASKGGKLLVTTLKTARALR